MLGQSGFVRMIDYSGAEEGLRSAPILVLDQTIMRGVYGLFVVVLFAAATLNLQAADSGQAANNSTAAKSSTATKIDDRPAAELAATLTNRVAPANLDPTPSPISPAAQELIRQLDDVSFDVRQKAAEQLKRLSREPEFAPALSEHFQRMLCDERTSFEVRTQLADLMRNLPAASSSPPKLPSAEIGHLLSLLDDDSFAVRTGAAERLKWLARNPAMICPLVETIKSRLAEADLSPASRQQLEPLWAKIHGAWLLSDATKWSFAPVSAKQIDHWIAELAEPVPEDQKGRSTEQDAAARELLDFLVRPDTAPVVIHALDVRLADPQLEPSAGRGCARFTTGAGRRRRGVLGQPQQPGDSASLGRSAKPAAGSAVSQPFRSLRRPRCTLRQRQFAFARRLSGRHCVSPSSAAAGVLSVGEFADHAAATGLRISRRGSNRRPTSCRDQPSHTRAFSRASPSSGRR